MEHGGKPYSQIKTNNGYIRTFLENVNNDELVWHRDAHTRHITILEGNNWKLQLDNKLPIKLEVGKTYVINREEWHRVIKGSNDLKIKITEI